MTIKVKDDDDIFCEMRFMYTVYTRINMLM